MKKIWIVIFLWTTCRGIVCTALGAEEILFDHLRSRDGLTNNMVTCLLQDSKGFMWIGTSNGLNKYDGYDFTHYFHERGNPNSLAGNNIMCLLEDHSGHIWIGTVMAGLSRLDPETGAIERLSLFPDRHSVRTIYEYPEGVLWLGAVKLGLVRLDTRNNEIIRMQPDPSKPGSLPGDFIHCIFADSTGTLWVGFENTGLAKFLPDNGTFIGYRHDPGKPGSLSHDCVLAVFEDSSGTMWVGTRGGGLNRFDRSAGTFTVYKHEAGNPASLCHNDVVTLCEDSRGVLWIGTQGGLCILDRETGTFKSYSPSPDHPAALSGRNVYDMVEDRSGILWFGTYDGGISIYDRKRNKFRRPRLPVPGTNQSQNIMITAVYQDTAGALWLGTFDRGMYRYLRKENSYRVFNHDPSNPKSLGHDSVTSITGDTAGNIWVGTNGGGIGKLDTATGTFSHYQQHHGESTGISSNKINTLYRDPNGVIWAGAGYPGGLNRIDPKTGKITVYNSTHDDPRTLSYWNVFALLTDLSGNLWVGTLMGLNRFDAETESFTRFIGHPDDPRGLSSNKVSVIYQSWDGTLWIGTEGGGLNRFNKSDETFDAFGSKEGLPDNVIYGILEDRRGSLWLSTNKGLCRFTPSGGQVKTYEPRDGLQGFEFYPGSSFKNPEGEMFFGGFNGFNSFFPEQIRDSSYVPPVLFTGFRIANQPVPVGNGSPLRKHISYAGEVELSYRDPIFTIEFAALDYANPSKNRYKYRLVGLNRDWISLGHERSLNFPALEPGSYTMEIMGTNSDGKWNPTPTKLHLVVTPPFWKTIWFRLLFLALVGLSIYAIHRRRMKHLTLKLKTENEMEQLFIKYNISPREKEIFQLMLKGKSNKEIEDILFISLPTVKTHIYKIYRKMNVKNRLELINLVQRTKPAKT